MARNEFHREFVADASSVAAVRRHVDEQLGERFIDGDVRASVLLCVSELASNAVLYAYPGSCGMLDVRVREQAETLELIVSDTGIGFRGSPLFGIGLGIVSALTSSMSIDDTDAHTEITARFAL